MITDGPHDNASDWNWRLLVPALRYFCSDLVEAPEVKSGAKNVWHEADQAVPCWLQVQILKNRNRKTPRVRAYPQRAANTIVIRNSHGPPHPARIPTSKQLGPSYSIHNVALLGLFVV